MITLHIYCSVMPGREEEFERVYGDIYVPAIAVQYGFQSTALLRAYDQERSTEIAARREWVYEIDIAFDTEEDRRSWAAGREHADAWPQVEALCERISWQGFDVLA